MPNDIPQMIDVKIETHSADDARRLAKTLIDRIGSVDRVWEHAVVIALTGPLGAGKTEFTKGLGAAIGIDPTSICSATFVIICEYEATGNNADIAKSDDQAGGKTLIHVDAYRLGGSAELDDIGFGEMLTRPDTLIAIEWAGRVNDILPADTLWIDQFATSPTDRIVRLTTRADSPWASIIPDIRPTE